MRIAKTVLRRLEALEEEERARERAREQKEQSLISTVCWNVWCIVLAYYLGDLKSDAEASKVEDIRLKRVSKDDPLEGFEYFEGFARALGYKSSSDSISDFSRAEGFNGSEYAKRIADACHRLFANVGLDFNKTAPSLLFDALVTMVNNLPEYWLSWLRTKLQESCGHDAIPPGSNLPSWLSADKFFTR
jgi:hypothetical protein